MTILRLAKNPTIQQASQTISFMPPTSDLQNTLQRQWVSKAQPQIMATAFGKTSILFPLGGPPVDIVSHCVFRTGNALMQLASPTCTGHLSRPQTQHLLLIGCGGVAEILLPFLPRVWGICGEITESSANIPPKSC